MFWCKATVPLKLMMGGCSPQAEVYVTARTSNHRVQGFTILASHRGLEPQKTWVETRSMSVGTEADFELYRSICSIFPPLSVWPCSFIPRNISSLGLLVLENLEKLLEPVSKHPSLDELSFLSTNTTSSLATQFLALLLGRK